MEKYINDVIDRHFEDNFVKTELNKIVPYIVNYYGDDYFSLVVEALRSTTIHLCPLGVDLQKYINSTLTVQIDNYFNKFLDAALISDSNGVSYTEQPYVMYDKDRKECVLKGTERKIIFLKEPNKRDPKVLENTLEIDRILIHEIVKKMKSLRNGYVIRSNKKISRVGLQTTYSRIDIINSKASVEFLSETGRAITNATCEYDTLCIFSDIFNCEFKDIHNPLEVYLVRKLFQNDKLKKVFHEIEFNGNIGYLRNYYDRLYYNGAFDMLVKLTDKIMNSNYKEDKEVYDKVTEEISEYINNLGSEDEKVLAHK